MSNQSNTTPLFDENAEVLRGMEDRGVDLGRARIVEFSHIFSDAHSASSFIQACKAAGFEGQDTTDDEMDHYDVTVSIEMVPNCERITVAEETLGNLAAQQSGHSDGWGFFSN